jgi:hypothetical protein
MLRVHLTFRLRVDLDVNKVPEPIMKARKLRLTGHTDRRPLMAGRWVKDLRLQI